MNSVDCSPHHGRAPILKAKKIIIDSPNYLEGKVMQSVPTQIRRQRFFRKARNFIFVLVFGYLFYLAVLANAELFK